VSVDKQDWVNYVGGADLNCKLATYLGTKKSPFEMAYGLDVLKPTNLPQEGTHLTLRFNQDGEDLAKKREYVLDLTKLLLQKSKNAT
jgi:hypothetical protein